MMAMSEIFKDGDAEAKLVGGGSPPRSATSVPSVGNISLEFVPCDLCGADDQELLFVRTDPVTGLDFSLVQCRCGMAFVNPMPTADSIPLLYPKDYLKDKRDMHNLYAQMAAFLSAAQKGKLLDVGCGRGDFVHYARQLGWDAEGADLLAWENAQDVPIHVGNFLHMNLPEHSYDVVTAWALLEHVRQPSAFFRKIGLLLNDQGKFIFVVPNVSAWGMRQNCAEDIPRHLWLFTPHAVERYLDRAGMVMESISHDDRLYTAYPFGLLRYALLRGWNRERHCSRYGNRSVALLRNRQIRGNFRGWLADVVRHVGPADLVLDAIDIVLGVILAHVSKLMGNYGIITVIARPRP